MAAPLAASSCIAEIVCAIRGTGMTGDRASGDAGSGEAVMGVFARVVPRAYSVVARLNSIGTSAVCNTHNSRYRCRQSATWHNSQGIVRRNADS